MNIIIWLYTLSKNNKDYEVCKKISTCSHHYLILFTLVSSSLQSSLSLQQKFHNFFILCNPNHPTSILFQHRSSKHAPQLFHFSQPTLQTSLSIKVFFLSHLKIAQITALIKKPKFNRDDPSNYRPISNLNNISKILERLFLARLQPHLINRPHYNPFQSVIPHTGAVTPLRQLAVLQPFCRPGESTLLVSLDLIAAFDTIDHAILLDRLRLTYGVDGTALNWLRSYLTQRFQYVKIGQDILSSVLLSTGVPQGSVLGLILNFTSFISPIQFVAANFKVDQQQYADDIQLWPSGIGSHLGRNRL